jgi:hypothetical protein
METVPRDIIEDTWNRLCDLDEKASAQISKEFFKVQPALGIYCAAQYEDLGKEGETSPMVELTIAVWQAMNQMAGAPLQMATPEEIEAAEEAITKPPSGVWIGLGFATYYKQATPNGVLANASRRQRPAVSGLFSAEVGQLAGGLAFGVEEVQGAAHGERAERNDGDAAPVEFGQSRVVAGAEVGALDSQIVIEQELAPPGEAARMA